MSSPVALVVKNPPANSRDIGNMASIPGSGRSPGEDMATHSSILAWETPWAEKPGGLQPVGSQRVRQDLATEHACIYVITLCAMKCD